MTFKDLQLFESAPSESPLIKFTFDWLSDKSVTVMGRVCDEDDCVCVWWTREYDEMSVWWDRECDKGVNVTKMSESDWAVKMVFQKTHET